MILIYLIRVVNHALLFYVAYHIMGCLCRCCVSYCACAYHQQLSDTNRQLFNRFFTVDVNFVKNGVFY